MCSAWMAAMLVGAAGAHELGPDPVVVEHLEGVEARLRDAPVDHLDAATQARRADLLDVLHGYHTAGAFPHNHVVPGRSPVFVDEHGTHCAVGYLLAADGRSDLVEEIVDHGNLRRVPEMSEPGLLDWAGHVGFTVEELAQIQPSYGSPVDNDNDGFPSDSDCDDGDRDVNPDQPEICEDNIDNDCDAEVDEADCTAASACSTAGPVTLLGVWWIVPLALWRRRRS